MVSDELALTIAGIGVMLAVPLTFMFANWVRKNVDYGEARFGSDGKVISDQPQESAADAAARPAQRIETSKASDDE